MWQQRPLPCGSAGTRRHFALQQPQHQLLAQAKAGMERFRRQRLQDRELTPQQPQLHQQIPVMSLVEHGNPRTWLGPEPLKQCRTTLCLRPSGLRKMRLKSKSMKCSRSLRKWMTRGPQRNSTCACLGSKRSLNADSGHLKKPRLLSRSKNKKSHPNKPSWSSWRSSRTKTPSDI